MRKRLEDDSLPYSIEKILFITNAYKAPHYALAPGYSGNGKDAGNGKHVGDGKDVINRDIGLHVSRMDAPSWCAAINGLTSLVRIRKKE